MSKFLLILSFVSIVVFTAACGAGAGNPGATGKVIKSGPAANNLTVTLSSADGVLRDGANDLTLSFTDAAGKPVSTGEFRVTGKCALVFIGEAKGALAQFSMKSSNTMLDEEGAEYLRVAPAPGAPDPRPAPARARGPARSRSRR